MLDVPVVVEPIGVVKTEQMADVVQQRGGNQSGRGFDGPGSPR